MKASWLSFAKSRKKSSRELFAWNWPGARASTRVRVRGACACVRAAWACAGYTRGPRLRVISVEAY